MKADLKGKLENFSNLEWLAEKLRTIETTHLEQKPSDGGALQGARGRVVSAVEHWSLSRYYLGEALKTYKDYFKAQRGWMEVSEAIANVLCCDSRTVRNTISDYQNLNRHLPANVIRAAHSVGIDLAWKRHAPVARSIEARLALVKNPDDDQAREIVRDATQIPARKSATEDLFESLTKPEKAHFKIRMKIRTALANIVDAKKLPELVAALEEEMHDVWGQTGPVTITITPRPSPLTLDGRKRRA